MKRLILLVLFILKLLVMHAQIPGIAWERCYGGTEADNCFAICEAHDGNYIIASTASSEDGDLDTNWGEADVWLVKVDSGDGSILWQQHHGGTDYDNCNAVITSLDGGYILTGETRSPFIPGSWGPTNYDMYVSKVDSAGNLQWHRCYGGSDDDGGLSIIQNADSTYMVAGYAESVDGDVTVQRGVYDYWVVKLDAGGNILWEKTYGGSTYDYATGIVHADSANYVVAGRASSNDSDVTGNHGGNDFWVIKIDSVGNLLWQHAFGGSQDDYCNSLAVLNNQYYCGGNIYSSDGDITGFHAGISDAWLIKIDSTGQLLNERAIGGSGGDHIYTVNIKSNDILVTSTLGSTDGDLTGLFTYGGGDFLAIRLDTSLNIQWVNNYGGNENDVARSSFISSSNDIVLAGPTLSDTGLTNYHYSPFTLVDIWVTRLDTALTMQAPESISMKEGTMVYPNPFHSEFTIYLNDDRRSFSYEITNSIGQTLIKKNIAGNSCTVNFSSYPAALYFLKIISGNQTTNFKILKK